MSPMLRGIIFDFDGVIVDSHPVHKRAWKKFFQSMGREVSDEDLKYVLDGRTREDILQHFCGELNAETIAEYGHRKEQIFRDEAANVQTVRGLDAFLEDLNDGLVTLAIASSGSRSRVAFLLNRLGLAKHFAVIVTADDVARGKPDPDLYLKAGEHLRIDSADLMVFEDAASGVRAAKAAGMHCVGVATSSPASALLQAGACHVVKDFRSISYSKILLFFSSVPRVNTL
jgi:beta-phosphoglucomutase